MSYSLTSFFRHYSRYRPTSLHSISQFGHYQRLEPISLFNVPSPPSYHSLLSKRLPQLVQPPPWALDASYSPPQFTEPVLLTNEQQHTLRLAGKLCKQALLHAQSLVQPGITSSQVDEQVFEFITSHGGYPSSLFYKGFPRSMCISINNVVAHGIPDDRPFKPTDLVTLDLAICLNGIHADCALTMTLPEVDAQGHALVDVSQKIFEKTLTACAPYQVFSIIPETIQSSMSDHQDFSYSIIPWLCGHGIGSFFHMAPIVYPTFHASMLNRPMVPGMAFTIEPVFLQGTSMEAGKWLDGWTIVSRSGARSAQFEETVLVTEQGIEIVTSL